MLLIYSLFSMATIKAHGSFVPFILPLHDNDHTDIWEVLFSLTFNLHMRTIYLEQERYAVDGEVYERTLVQKNKTEVVFMWILGLGSGGW